MTASWYSAKPRFFPTPPVGASAQAPVGVLDGLRKPSTSTAILPDTNSGRTTFCPARLSSSGCGNCRAATGIVSNDAVRTKTAEGKVMEVKRCPLRGRKILPALPSARRTVERDIPAKPGPPGCRAYFFFGAGFTGALCAGAGRCFRSVKRITAAAAEYRTSSLGSPIWASAEGSSEVSPRSASALSAAARTIQLLLLAAVSASACPLLGSGSFAKVSAAAASTGEVLSLVSILNAP